MSADLAVVVLAGGQGRRMGGGKPLRRFAGQTLIARALASARGWSPLVAVAVKAAEQVGEAVDAPLLLDWPEVDGPLSGLAAALAFAASAGARSVMTLPCDMPFAPAGLAGRLRRALSRPVRACVPTSDGRLHPACAVWSTDCLESLEAYVATGGRSLKGFAAFVGGVEVACDDWREALSANVNTPADLTRLEHSLEWGRIAS
jgi:molybdopterin-guanine dinucleotide biosynthesis protein A